MTDFTDAVNALRTKLQEFSTLPLFWPNDQRDPSGSNAKSGFVYSETRLTSEGPVSIGPDGSRTHRDFGEMSVYVYVPRGTKSGTAEAHAQTIRNLFKLNAVAGVRITGRTIGAGAIVSGPNGSWYSVPIFISWFADRIE